MDRVLSRPAKELNQGQHEAYFRDGFIGIEGFIGEPWLSKLHGMPAEFIGASRRVVGKDKRFDLEASHSAD